MQKLALAWTHVVRAVAMALAALSLCWGIASSAALGAAVAGAVLGVVLGQWLARSSVRLAVVFGAAALVLIGFWGLSTLALRTELVPSLLGPGLTLRVAGALRFGVFALALTTALRLLAARRPSAVGLEVVAIAGALTTVFAGHRDGVIARPLWISDWAWRQGVDPTRIFLAIGFVAVGLLGILLLAERKSGRSLSSLLVLLCLGTLAVLLVHVVGPPQHDPLSDLGLNDSREGAPPIPPDAGGGDDKGNQDGGGRDPLDGGAQDGGGMGQGLDAGADAGQKGQLDGGSDAGQSDAGADGGTSSSPPRADQPPSDDPNVSNNPAAMAVVILEDDYSPPAQAYYFREEVLSQFTGTRLVPTSRGDADLDVPRGFPTQAMHVDAAPGPSSRARVHARVAMIVEHAAAFALEAPTDLAPLPNPNPSRFVRAYRFEALSQSVPYKALLGRKAGDARWSEDLRAYYTKAPSDPRYGDLARKALEQIPPQHQGDPFAKAIAVKLFLDRALTYSSKERHAGAADPTADMLFGNKTGYCVHFAHAAVYLWRTLGVPSRVGTGYHAAEDDRHGGSAILLRAGDAHAWPELYLDGVGWIVLDIAAAKNLDPPRNPPDDELQRLLGDMARNQPPDPSDPPKKKRSRSYGRELSMAGLVLVVLALALLYAIKIWRRVTPSFAGARTIPRVGYRAALDVLADVGLARQFGETREDFARRAAEVAPSFEALTGMHLAARLRDPGLARATRPELLPVTWRDTLRAMRAEVAARSRRWRRWLGILNPASFLDSR